MWLKAHERKRKSANTHDGSEFGREAIAVSINASTSKQMCVSMFAVCPDAVAGAPQNFGVEYAIIRLVCLSLPLSSSEKSRKYGAPLLLGSGLLFGVAVAASTTNGATDVIGPTSFSLSIEMSSNLKRLRTTRVQPLTAETKCYASSSGRNVLIMPSVWPRSRAGTRL